MTVQIRIIEHNPTAKTVTVEAYSNSHRIMRSPMKYTTYTRKALDTLLKKGLKAFDTPQWGGYDVLYLISFDK